MVFCFIQKFFSGQHESYNIYFFCRTKREFFPEFNIRLYDKNSETNFSPPKSDFSNIGNQNICLEKNHNPPLEVKWSVPNFLLKR